jgi:hypothetical protein
MQYASCLKQRFLFLGQDVAGMTLLLAFGNLRGASTEEARGDPATDHTAKPKEAHTNR